MDRTNTYDTNELREWRAVSYYDYVKGEPRRDSQRPRDPKPGMQPDQVAHAEFILSTRQTRLTLERC